MRGLANSSPRTCPRPNLRSSGQISRAVGAGAPHTLPSLLFPLVWLLVVISLGAVSAIHHNKFRLVFTAPLALLYVLIAYAAWLMHGVRSLITGHEYNRDKPTRYARVVA